MSDADDIFDLYARLLSGGFAPESMQMTLGDLRAWEAEGADLSPAVRRFLADAAGVPGEAIVWLSSGRAPAFATDGEGNLQAFS